MQEEKYIGKVVWFDASLGYGFISRENETDLFVYWSDIVSEGFKTLKKGQEVAFSIGLSSPGYLLLSEASISAARISGPPKLAVMLLGKIKNLTSGKSPSKALIK